MAVTATLLGVNYSIPEPTDAGYDQGLTNYLKALAASFPQLSGGAAALTAELDFGASFGLKALYLKTETALPAGSGVVRLAAADALAWRNAANSADVALAKDSGDNLLFGGQNVTGNPMLSATTSAGQSIPASTITIIVYGTVGRDTDNAYNATTGRYTVPVGKGGDYLVAATYAYGAAVTGLVTIYIYKNGAQIWANQFINPGVGQALPISAIVNAAAGDIIDIRAFQNTAGAVTLSTTAILNAFTLKRVPT